MAIKMCKTIKILKYSYDQQGSEGMTEDNILANGGRMRKEHVGSHMAPSKHANYSFFFSRLTRYFFPCTLATPNAGSL
jgi:hypothetical protein